MNDLLATVLIQMFKLDQTTCEMAQESDNPEQFDWLFRDHAESLKQIIAKYGWPGYTLVGTQGALAAWIIVQHADHDHAFQIECLDLLADAVRRGDASPRNLAYLIDRTLVNAEQAQIFGTQYHRPIFDEAHVDERRALYGMEPLTSYLDRRARKLKASHD